MPLEVHLQTLPLTGDSPALRRIDCGILIAFCLLLFGYSMFSGRPLSLHEARLPEVSREMTRNGDWLIPASGGRPWLERPPLPHWITVSVSAILGQHCDSVWVVRLPAALAGTAIVLMTAWIAARLFGRSIGVCSGFVLATSYEFYAYACLAEDDIFLGLVVVAAVAVFVGMEFDGQQSRVIPQPTSNPILSIFGSRPWPMVAFFALLGLTNFAKGPLVGAAVVIATIGVYLLWPIQLNRIQKYVWFWGILIFTALTVAWPLVVYLRYKAEAVDNWKFDYTGTSEYDQHVWYYPIQLLGALAPWTPALFFGFRQTAVNVWRNRAPAERFLWCWAILPIIVLSLPHRKHHHYLVPSLAPWAIICAIGLHDIALSMFRGPLWSRTPRFGLLVFGLPLAAAILLFHSKIPCPFVTTVLLAIGILLCVALFYTGLFRKRASLLLAAIVLGISLAFSWGQSYLPDLTTQDTQFLHQVEAAVPRDIPLYINADLHGELDFFRIAFYLRPQARLLHNLTFLRDDKIIAPQVYLITREWDAPALTEFGQVETLFQSEKSRPSGHAKKAKLKNEKFTLYRITFNPNLARYPAPTHISTMQAMGRERGPYCGPT